MDHEQVSRIVRQHIQDCPASQQMGAVTVLRDKVTRIEARLFNGVLADHHDRVSKIERRIWWLAGVILTSQATILGLQIL